MMLFIIILVLLTVNGVFADVKRCTPFDAFDKCNLPIEEIVAPITPQKLTKFCSLTREFYKCYDEKQSRKDKNNPCGESSLVLLLASRSIIGDLCNISSRTHQEFITHFPCMKQIGDEFLLCEKKLDVLYQRYLQILEEEDFGEKEPPQPLKKCLKVLYRMICVNTGILKICGNSADKIFAQLIEESGLLRLYCSDMDLKDAMIIIKLDQKFQKSEKPTAVTINSLFEWLEA